MTRRIASILAGIALSATGAVAQSGDCLHVTIPIDAIDRTNQEHIQSVSNIREEQLIVEAGGHKARVISLKPLRMGRVVLVLDNSGSMSDKWSKVKSATLDLVTRMPPTVAIGLLVFSDKIEEFVPPDQPREVLVQRLRTLPDAAKRTRLWDSLEETMVKLGPLQAGDAMFLITDGGDNLSSTSEGKIKKLLVNAGTRVFAVTIYELAPPTPEERGGPADLADLTAATGGYARTIDNVAELPHSLSFLAGQSLSYSSAELLFDQTPKSGAPLKIRLEGSRDQRKHIELVYPRVLRVCSARVANTGY